MPIDPQRGFTLFELVIALAIASILMGFAVPSFISAMRSAELGKVIEPARRALMIARSEAAKRAGDVTVCPRASDTACGSDWNAGLLVFVDGFTVPDEVSATRDGGDTILMIVPPHDTGHSLRVIASDNRTASGAYTPNYIRYGLDGRASWQNGTIIACDERGEEHSRALNVTLVGSMQEALSESGGIVHDVFGREIDCS